LQKKPGIHSCILLKERVVRVVDSDAASYVSQPATHVLTSAEDEKIRKYHDACESKGGYFTPLVMSADGVLAPQATKFLETLAKRLTEKQNSLCNASYGETINWLRLRLQFASVGCTLRSRLSSLLVTIILILIHFSAERASS
jgi:hypothetical protein